MFTRTENNNDNSKCTAINTIIAYIQNQDTPTHGQCKPQYVVVS